jgi:hypothetical protein
MYNSALTTADDRYNLEFCLYLDWDDEESIKHLARIGKRNLPLTRVMVGERIKQSAMWNSAAGLATGEIMMQCADDAVFLTQGWDTLIINAFNEYPDRIALVWGNDGFQSEHLATLGFIHRNWYETVGYFVPPIFDCWYSDTWLTNVATGLDRRHYIPELMIEHEHPSVNKAQWDDTYTYRLTDENIATNGIKFQKMANLRRLDMIKLKQYIQSQGDANAAFIDNA